MVWTSQPMQYGLPGQYPNIQNGQQPGYPQMQMMQSVQQSNNTTIILNQPQQRRAGMMACCCAPYYSCFLAVELGESCCLPMCFCPGECIPLCGTSVPWLIALRVKLREANKIQGSIMGDCMAVCCCPLCVMCQLKREHDFTRQHPNNE